MREVGSRGARGGGLADADEWAGCPRASAATPWTGSPRRLARWTTEQKVELALRERAARAVAGVTQVEASVYSDTAASVALANSRGFAGSYSATQAWAYASAFAGEGADLMTGLGVGMGRDPAALDPEAIGARGGRASARPGRRAPAGEPPLPGGPGRVRGRLVRGVHRRDAVRGRRPARTLPVRRPRGRGGGPPGARARRRRDRPGGAGQRTLRRGGLSHPPDAADRGWPPPGIPVRLAHGPGGRGSPRPAACGTSRGSRCRSSTGRPCGRSASRRGSPGGAPPRSAPCAGWACPRRRRARSPGPSGSVPSSASRSAGPATSSPSRPANSERPRCTASADSIAPMNPTNDAATNESSTTGQRRLSGWRAPTSASARSAASAPIASGSSAPGSRPIATPSPVMRSPPSPAKAEEYAHAWVASYDAANPRELASATEPRPSEYTEFSTWVTPSGARAARSTASASSTTAPWASRANSGGGEPSVRVPSSSGRPSYSSSSASSAASRAARAVSATPSSDRSVL